MKNKIYYTDGLLTLAILFLSSLSIFMVYSSWSITSIVFGGSSFMGIFGKQALFLVLAVIVYFLAVKIPYKVYYNSAYALWGLSVVLLVVVYLFDPVNDSRSWIQLPLVNFQPSELAKIAVILAVGKYYQRLINRKEPVTLVNGLVTPSLLVLIPAALTFFQPDPGTVVIMLGISFCCLIASGLRLRFFLKHSVKVFAILFGLISMFAIANLIFDGAPMNGLKESQSRMIGRFNDYDNPCGDYYGDGFQICNSLIAINTGGLTGKGIGNSTQKYLYIPESHTDAIFAVTAEELGFIVVGFILLVYLFIVLRILYYAKRAPDKFSQITCIGVAALILIHVFVNVGGIINLIPFTGVPLPFFSYGGSFLLMCFGFLGIVQSIIISIKRDGDVE